MEPTGGQCGVQPSFIFLLVTLLVTSIATAMLCAAIMTEHWENIMWDRGKLEEIEKHINNSTNDRNEYKIEWLLNGQVARVLLAQKPKDAARKQMFKFPAEDNDANENRPALFFVPVHGGIWTICISLEAEEKQLLDKLGFPQINCTRYLTPEMMREEVIRTDWQHRMQNLSISCALVCLIILGSSALVGVFGIMKHEISAVLVTGVMYLLAATFAMFTLTIIHFKRAPTRGECMSITSTIGLTTDGVITSTSAQERPYNLGRATDFFVGRVFTTGWSLHLGWGGVGMCIVVSILWILLSNIMRLLRLEVTGVTERIRKPKLEWAGQAARSQICKWTTMVNDCSQKGNRRPRKRPGGIRRKNEVGMTEGKSQTSGKIEDSIPWRERTRKLGRKG